MGRTHFLALFNGMFHNAFVSGVANVKKHLFCSLEYSSGVEQTLCGLTCPGQLGIPPSLQCAKCMCLFHPICAQFFGSRGFICQVGVNLINYYGSSMGQRGNMTTMSDDRCYNL